MPDTSIRPTESTRASAGEEMRASEYCGRPLADAKDEFTVPATSRKPEYTSMAVDAPSPASIVRVTSPPLGAVSVEKPAAPPVAPMLANAAASESCTTTICAPPAAVGAVAKYATLLATSMAAVASAPMLEPPAAAAERTSASLTEGLDEVAICTMVPVAVPRPT